jgi:hypothetical protein
MEGRMPTFSKFTEAMGIRKAVFHPLAEAALAV